jgi:hypothetical protein
MSIFPSISSPGRGHLAVVAALLILGGCATTSNVQQIDKLESVGDEAHIVLMPPDIRYYLLTAGGVPEPNAEWTEAAQKNFLKALEDYSESIGANTTAIDKTNLSEDEIRYETLHAAVGLTLRTHYFGMTKLPAKGDTFDWSLGPDISSIGENHNADYALFVYYRDYQASGGRVAFSLLASLAGVGVPMGAEYGFASLVDLHSGDIVWFNVVNLGGGELRDEAGAATAVKTLFKDMPTQQGSVEAQ